MENEFSKKNIVNQILNFWILSLFINKNKIWNWPSKKQEINKSTIFTQSLRVNLDFIGPFSDLNRLLDYWIWCGSAQIA